MDLNNVSKDTLLKEVKQEHIFVFVCKYCKLIFKSVPEFLNHKLSHNEALDRCSNLSGSGELVVGPETKYADIEDRLLSETDSSIEIPFNEKVTLVCTGHSPHAIKIPEDAKEPLDTQVCQQTIVLEVPGKNCIVLFICAACDRLFDSNRELKLHQVVHTRPFACPVCPKRCSTTKDLHDHVTEMHASVFKDGISSKIKLSCRVCLFKTKCTNSLCHHLKQHRK